MKTATIRIITQENAGIKMTRRFSGSLKWIAPISSTWLPRWTVTVSSLSVSRFMGLAIWHCISCVLCKYTSSDTFPGLYPALDRVWYELVIQQQLMIVAFIKLTLLCTLADRLTVICLQGQSSQTYNYHHYELTVEVMLKTLHRHAPWSGQGVILMETWLLENTNPSP